MMRERATLDPARPAHGHRCSSSISVGLVYALITGADTRPVIGDHRHSASLALLDVLLSASACSSSTRTRRRCCSCSASYVGTVREPGLRWANPFYTKQRISLRVRNFESAQLKVNDHDGNPIEIAAVVVWRVVDTAEAVFHVDDYEQLRPRAERVGAAQPGDAATPTTRTTRRRCRCAATRPRSPST